MPLEPGSRLGGYEIVELLGAGGMGEVYRARDIEPVPHSVWTPYDQSHRLVIW